MSFDQSQWLWMNGEVIRWQDATVHVSSHALHYGTGVFEGMRCYKTPKGPAVFRLAEHIDRLFASAAVYEMPIPYSRDDLHAAVHETVQRNGFESCYIRPVCFYGSSVLSVHPRSCPVEVAVFAWPWGKYLGDAEDGVRVTVSKWVRLHSSMLPTTAKACGQYLNSLLANREAAAKGFDEAILLDSEGFISEGSGENLFIVRDGRVVTNDEDSSILLGITRDAVITIARDLGYEVDIRKLEIGDLLGADEAFFTGTATEVMPIREVDGQLIGNGLQGPVTRGIRQAFSAAATGENPRYDDWLSVVMTAEAEVLT